MVNSDEVIVSPRGIQRACAYAARLVLCIAVCVTGARALTRPESRYSRAQTADKAGAPNGETIPKGVVVPKVACALDPDQSYALYLPSGYDSGKPWPILYCFDPGAQGGIPVDSFREGAEKFGYIVVGSNNSRNGPMTIASAAINAVWKDTHARFNIDDSRIYAAGFSGGARVACQFGFALAGKIAGIVACGAGFPTNITPSRSTPFVVFSTVGNADFNYPEMVRLARALDAAGVAGKLRIFDGPHQWAPRELCTDAIEWLQLQAIKSGKLEKSPAFVEDLFQGQVAAARAYEASSKPYEAYLAYEAVVKDFKGLKNLDELDKKAADLKNSREVKQALKQEKEDIDKQTVKERELQALKRVALGPTVAEAGEGTADAGVSRATAASEDRAAALADLKKAIAGLRKKSEESSPDSIVWKRVLQGFFVQCYETASGLLQSKSYAMAAANLQLAAEIRPDGRGVFYNLACAYSRLKEKNKALTALKRAVDNGYSDLHALESDPDLDAIRSDPEFHHILENLAGKKRQ